MYFGIITYPVYNSISPILSSSHNPVNYHRLKAPAILRILWCLRISNRLVIRKCAAKQLFQEPLFGSHTLLSFWVTSFRCREVFHMALELFVVAQEGFMSCFFFFFFFLFMSAFQRNNYQLIFEDLTFIS